MKKVFCDRCKENTGDVTSQISIDTPDGIDKRDLCANCMHDLVKFLSGRRLEGD